MTILVTGCAGFIGSHVAEALLKRGDTVIGIDNFSSLNYPVEIKKENLKGLGKYSNFSFYEIDITNLDDLENLKGIKKIIHLAALPGVALSMKHPEKYMAVNILGTQNVLSIARNAVQVIFASSSSVYGTNQKIPFNEEDPTENQISVYSWTKKTGETLCKFHHTVYGVPVTCLRFFNVYGPRGRPDMAPYIFTKALLEGKPITLFGDGSMKRDWTYVEDILQGVLAAIDTPRGYEIVNLGNNQPVSTLELIHMLEEITGKRAVIEMAPEREGDVPVTYADISKAQKIYKYSATYPLQKGLTHFVKWYEGKYHGTRRDFS